MTNEQISIRRDFILGKTKFHIVLSGEDEELMKKMIRHMERAIDEEYAWKGSP